MAQLLSDIETKNEFRQITRNLLGLAQSLEPEINSILQLTGLDEDQVVKLIEDEKVSEKEQIRTRNNYELVLYSAKRKRIELEEFKQVKRLLDRGMDIGILMPSLSNIVPIPTEFEKSIEVKNKLGQIARKLLALVNSLESKVNSILQLTGLDGNQVMELIENEKISELEKERTAIHNNYDLVLCLAQGKNIRFKLAKELLNRGIDINKIILATGLSENQLIELNN